MLSVFVVVAIHSVLGSFTTWLNGGLGRYVLGLGGRLRLGPGVGSRGPHTSPQHQGPRRASLISEVPLVNGTQGDWGWGECRCAAAKPNYPS